MDIGPVNVGLLTCPGIILPKFVDNRSGTFSVWDFTLDNIGNITFEPQGNAPYEQGMKSVMRCINAMDHLQALTSNSSNNPYHFWKGGARVIADRDISAVHSAVLAVRRIHARQEHEGSLSSFDSRCRQFEKDVLQVRIVALECPMLMVRACQTNSRGKPDYHPIRNGSGLNNVLQQTNRMSVNFLAVFLKVEIP